MDDLTIRTATAEDRPAVLSLLEGSLGWQPDEDHADFFAWKHDANPFGASWAWVAEDPKAGIVGLRTFLRWRFERAGGGSVEAVRAVDTATAASHRGAGIFSRLTLHGLEEVRAAGVDFVFNTPNDQSRPGYLKMGWEEVGRLAAQIRPRSPAALRRVVRSKTPADLWSVPCAAGFPAADVLGGEAIDALVDRLPAPNGLRTALSGEFLRWRYAGFGQLGYRALLVGATPADGLVIFRLRRRGSATECVIGHVIAPDMSARLGADLARRALRESKADHAIALAMEPYGRWPGFIRTSALGPTLTWRAAATPLAAPPLDRWQLVLGDIELF